MIKLFFYGLAGFLLALTLISLNSMLIKHEGISISETREPTMKILINEQSSRTSIKQEFSSIFYTLIFSLITALSVYLIAKKRF